MINCVIVDDEKQGRNALRSELDNFKQLIKIVAEADSAATAVQVINEYRPDMVFMDIHLGDGTGFSVLEKTSWNSFKVVFVTAYDEYAIKAFKFNAIDYLLKPVSSIDVKAVMDRLAALEPTREQSLNRNFMSNYKNAAAKRIAISNSDGIHLVDIKDIVRCEADGNYTLIYTMEGEIILTSKTLKDHEAILAEFNFERVHHSHLVNIDHIKKYLNRETGFLQMKDGSQVPIAQRKKSYVLGLLEKLA